MCCGVMMSEKQFRTNDLVKFDYSEIGEYVDENHTPTPLRNDEVCKLLNEQQATIQSLKEENEQLRQSVEYWQKKYEEGTETFQID